MLKFFWFKLMDSTYSCRSVSRLTFQCEFLCLHSHTNAHTQTHTWAQRERIVFAGVVSRFRRANVTFCHRLLDRFFSVKLLKMEPSVRGSAGKPRGCQNRELSARRSLFAAAHRGATKRQEVPHASCRCFCLWLCHLINIHDETANRGALLTANNELRWNV